MNISTVLMLIDPDNQATPSHVCVPTELPGPTGTIQTPNYPDRYPSDIECEWRIQVEETKVKDSRIGPML